MTLTALNRQLTDLGGVTVLWDSGLGTLVQDPSQVPAGMSQNRYGPGDLFQDANTGDVYQLQADGALTLYRAAVAAAPVVPGPAGATLSSAGPSWSSSPPTTSGAAISTTGDPTQWAHQAVNWLSKASFIGGLPNGLLIALGYVGYTFMRQRRRHNPRPILRNPYGRRDRRAARHAARELARRRGEVYGYVKSLPAPEARDYYAGRRQRRRFLRGINPGGARVIYSRVLGGWYVVVGPHQTPISGRFASKGAALASMRRR